eukprot:3623007-Alexandrium_andersonii.AAC.1
MLGRHEHNKPDAHLAAKCIAIVAALCWPQLLAKGVALNLHGLWFWTTAFTENAKRAGRRVAAVACLMRTLAYGIGM